MVLPSQMIYEQLGMVPGITQVPPHVLWRFRPKGPEPDSVSPLPIEAGDLGLVVVVMVWGWLRRFKGRFKIGLVCSERLISAAAAAKLLQSCPTLCDSINGSPLGFPVPGILQARTLE